MYHHARGIRMIGRSGRPDVPGTLTYYRAMLAAEHRGEQDDDLARLYWRVCTTPSMVLPPERSAKERMRD